MTYLVLQMIGHAYLAYQRCLCDLALIALVAIISYQFMQGNPAIFVEVSDGVTQANLSSADSCRQHSNRDDCGECRENVAFHD